MTAAALTAAQWQFVADHVELIDPVRRRRFGNVVSVRDDLLYDSGMAGLMATAASERRDPDETPEVAGCRAKATIRRAMRRRLRWTRSVVPLLLYGALDFLIDRIVPRVPTAGPADGVRREIRQAVERLGRLDRAVVELTYYGGWTDVAIAAELGITQRGVIARRRHAHERLRTALQKEVAA